MRRRNMHGFKERHVAICVCTFRRQKLLRELLRGIADLTFFRVPCPRLEVVVVDNDEHGSAQELCRSTLLPWPLKYVIEPRRGLTYARNRSIAEAGAVESIASIDDDEVPSPAWLDELLWTQAEFSADVVAGPVLPEFAHGVPEWIRTGGFFDSRVSAATGTQRSMGGAGNVLIARHVFTKVPGFDDAYALSGAEDTDFFLRAARVGYKIVWSQEAVVFEHISAKRGSAGWILRREYQRGNGWVFCEGAVDGRLRKRATRFAKACGHVVVGSARATLAALLLDKLAVLRALQRVTLGAGMLTALAGHRYLAYQTKNIQPLQTEKAMLQTPT
ncbi:MAG: glycosyltransferase family 2 protein [Terriglobales bacterium]